MRVQERITGWLPWLGVLLIAWIVVSPLWGQPPPYGDDIRLHFYRIPLLNALWAAGAPYARWMPYLNFGYGSPLFNFYPPLSAYLLTVLYWLVGQNALTAVNLLFALSLSGSAAGMFLLGRTVHGTAGGLLAAALYAWSPHLVYQTYARGSTSNALAMALFPFVVWAFIRLGQRPLGQRPLPMPVLGAALLLALVLLSHTAASLLFLAPLLALAGAAVYAPPLQAAAVSLPDKATSQPGLSALWLRLWPVLLALLLGLGLSAFAWLPALAEIGHTRYEQEAGKVDFHDHFAEAWRWPAQTVAGAHNPGLPKSPGLAQLALGSLGAMLALFTFWRPRNKINSRIPAIPLSAALITAVAGFLGLAMLFLSVSWSAPVWEAAAPLRALQFPWRLLDIPTFCLPLAAGFVFRYPLSVVRNASHFTVYIALLLFLSIAFANLLAYLYPPRIPMLPVRPTLADVTAVQQQFGIYGLTAWGEYSNRAIQTWPSGPPFAGADENISLAQKVLEQPPGITAVSGNPWRAVWQSNLPHPTSLTLAVHYFPGWQAWLDGERLLVGVDEHGRLQLTLPAGEHRVELAFGRTRSRWLADGLTAVSLLWMFATFAYVIGNKRRKPAGLKQRAALASGAHPLSVAAAGPKLSTPGQPVPYGQAIMVILCLLLMLKLLWADRVHNPLVTHPLDGRIPGAVAAPAANFNDEIRLAGYQLADSGALTLYWQASTAPARWYTVVLSLADAHGAPVKEWRNKTPGYTVTSNWEPGQLTRDVYRLPLDLLPAPAGYSLSLSLVDEATGEPALLADAPGQTAVPLGRLKNPPPLFRPPETISALFGDAIKLRHAELPAHIAAGEPLALTLIWESAATTPTDYTVFVHLLHADGSLAAGQDGPPVSGFYPTSFWAPGEVIVDARRWQPELPPGVYQVQVGLYRPDTGERLTILPLGDRLILGEVAITSPGD